MTHLCVFRKSFVHIRKLCSNKNCSKPNSPMDVRPRKCQSASSHLNGTKCTAHSWAATLSLSTLSVLWKGNWKIFKGQEDLLRPGEGSGCLGTLCHTILRSLSLETFQQTPRGETFPPNDPGDPGSHPANLEALSTYHPRPRCQRHPSEKRWSCPQPGKENPRTDKNGIPKHGKDPKKI